MPKIFVPQKNQVLEVAAGTNLMSALLRAHIPVASSCLADGICGKCRMQITGDIAPAEKIEIDTKRRNKIGDDERLACQITVDSDLTVYTSYW